MQLLLTSDATACANALLTRLTAELSADRKVLWYLTGGSNISTDIDVMTHVAPELTTNLTITLTDERYGDYGHADSNWQQLLDGGLDTKQARTFPVLQQDNQSLEQTTQIYASNLDVALAEADVVIGFYGMGPDGHIAGILPGTPAVNASGLAFGYQTDQFTRITTTFETIRRCHVAYVNAPGGAKRSALEQLQQDVALNIQPAQVLKQIPESYVFNDQIGDQL